MNNNQLVIISMATLLLVGCSETKNNYALPISVSASEIGMFAEGYSWYLSVDNDGIGILRIGDSPESESQSIMVGNEQLAQLRALVHEVDFFSLNDIYGEQVFDGGKDTISVTVGDDSKTVKIYYLMNWVHGSSGRLKDPARALKVKMLVRSWISDPRAVDLRRYDQMVLNAVGQ